MSLVTQAPPRPNARVGCNRSRKCCMRSFPSDWDYARWPKKWMCIPGTWLANFESTLAAHWDSMCGSCEFNSLWLTSHDQDLLLLTSAPALGSPIKVISPESSKLTLG